MIDVYKTEWVEDLPEKTDENTIYIVGGRRHPFHAVIPCPKRECTSLFHLELRPTHSEGWTLKEHPDGTVTLKPSIKTLKPSINLNESPCHCHWFIQKGCVVWPGS